MSLKWRALVAACVIAGGAMPLASCGLIKTQCASGIYDFVANPHGSKTPLLAAEQWAITNADITSAPLSGWKEMSSTATEYKLKSGDVTVTVTRVPDGTWMVRQYESCH